MSNYEQMDRESTANFVVYAVQIDITADITDDQMEELMEQCERAANEQGGTLHWGQMRSMFESRRYQLQTR